MTCLIDAYDVASGDFVTDIALDNLRLSVRRVYDLVIPIGGDFPVPIRMKVTKSIVDFVVTRVHDSVNAAEAFALAHNSEIPTSGPIQLISSNGTTQRYLVNARVTMNRLKSEVGATTIHSYHIEGGLILSSLP